MTHFRILSACILATVVAGASYAQLPGMPPNGQAFDGNIYKPQSPPTADPAATLMGEAPPPRKIWSGNVEAGFNGQTGNTELTNLRSGFHLQRKTDDNFFTSDFAYSFSKQQRIETQNQALFNARDEVLFAGSPWSLFASTNIEWDKFKAYDLLVGVYGGVGYTVLDDGQTLFKLRAGAGTVRRFGGPDERWIPEAVFGFDLNHKFTDRQSFVSSVDYYPRLDKFSQYRIRARAAYEIIVDPSMGMALRLGAQSRFDSDPGPATKRHDLNYFATLAFNF